MKYILGFFAGITLSFTVAAGTANNCDAWKIDAVVYEAAILILCDGDLDTAQRVKENMGEAARRALSMKNNYTYEIDSTSNANNKALLKLGNEIIKEVNEMVREAKPQVDA